MPLSDVHTHVFAVEETHVSYVVSSEREIPRQAQLGIANAVFAINVRIADILAASPSRDVAAAINADKGIQASISAIQHEFWKETVWFADELRLPGKLEFPAEGRLMVSVSSEAPISHFSFQGGTVSVPTVPERVLKT